MKKMGLATKEIKLPHSSDEHPYGYRGASDEVLAAIANGEVKALVYLERAFAPEFADGKPTGRQLPIYPGISHDNDQEFERLAIEKLSTMGTVYRGWTGSWEFGPEMEIRWGCYFRARMP
jgi:hypothetical protein